MYLEAESGESSKFLEQVAFRVNIYPGKLNYENGLEHKYIINLAKSSDYNG